MKRAFALSIVLFVSRFAPHLLAAEDPFAKWESEIQKLEAHDRAQKQPLKGSILFVGSSSIRMWTNLVESFPKKRIIQHGFGGSTMADALHFADRIILSCEPKEVFIYEGDNDLAAGKEPKVVAAEFRQLVEKIHGKLPKTQIWFISVKPSPSRAKLEPKVLALNSEIEWWIRGQKRVGYIDVWTPMMGADGKPRPEIFRDDKLHMNAAGYEIWKKIIGKKI